MLAHKISVVEQAIAVNGASRKDPIGAFAALGGFEHAAMVGLLLGGASLRTPVILDGVSAGAAALVARAIAPEVLAACIAGHRSAEPGHVAALNKLGLRPLVDLDLRLGAGTGALPALPPYLHLLGANREALSLLKEAHLPVSHALMRLKDENDACARMVSAQLTASDFSALCRKTPEPMGSALRQKIIFLTK